MPRTFSWVVSPLCLCAVSLSEDGSVALESAA